MAQNPFEREQEGPVKNIVVQLSVKSSTEREAVPWSDEELAKGLPKLSGKVAEDILLGTQIQRVQPVSEEARLFNVMFTLNGVPHAIDVVVPVGLMSKAGEIPDEYDVKRALVARLAHGITAHDAKSQGTKKHTYAGSSGAGFVWEQDVDVAYRVDSGTAQMFGLEEEKAEQQS